MKSFLSVAAVLLFVTGCSGSNENSPEDVLNPSDQSPVDVAEDTGADVVEDTGRDTVADTAGDTAGDTGTDTATSAVSVYAGSASFGDLVVFSVDHDAGTCEVVNETTGQNSNVNFTVMDGELSGVMQISTPDEEFYAVELTDKLIAASFDTGNPNNTISFGVDGATDNMVNIANIPGDYVFINISGAAINGTTDIKAWGVMSVIDDGTVRIKIHATDVGDASGPTPMAPEEYVGASPIDNPDTTGTWSVNMADHARLNVTLPNAPSMLTGFAYAPDPNAIFVLDMLEGNGFILAMKILPAITLANLAGEYKYINVWNDSKGEGRSAGKAVINADGTGSFGAISTEGVYSEGAFDGISSCPLIQNMFYTTSTESDGVNMVTLKHYFVLLPYAFMGFNFRTDGGFRFVGYSVGARLDQ